MQIGHRQQALFWPKQRPGRIGEKLDAGHGKGAIKRD
jgi:hypothetical protein